MDAYHYPHQHLLDIRSLSRDDIVGILSQAEKYIALNRQPYKKQDNLLGRTVINVFFENSTRTRTSFELAAKRLSADVINMQVQHSAIHKGETLIDTAATLNAMHPDIVVMRHPESGAVQLLSRKINGHVINAGDGGHEHPTQALLDALTIKCRIGSQGIEGYRDAFEGRIIAICGDIIHSRVARSNITLLNTMGAKVRIIAPPTLLPRHPEALGEVEIYTDMREGLKDADIVMMLRMQKERMSGHFIPSEREYFHLFGLDAKKLKIAKPDVFIMHPGPINRGLEIDSELADDINRSVILDQVEVGVAVRQSVLEVLS